MNSPLEQFNVIKLISITLNGFDLSITNSSIYSILTVFLIVSIFSTFYWEGGQLIPNKYQVIIENFYSFLISLVKEQIGPSAPNYFGLVCTTWLYIQTANLLGLIPFSFAITAQLIVAFGLSFSLFIGVTIIGLLKHGFHFLSFFLPSGAPIGLAPLLVIIEIISYIFRPISLGVRLFANITAGHSLLSIIGGFVLSIGSSKSIFSFFCFLPIPVIVAIFGLELAVALLQAYVFGVLLCIYLKDAVELH